MTSGKKEKKTMRVKRKQIEVQIVVVWKTFLMKNSPQSHSATISCVLFFYAFPQRVKYFDSPSRTKALLTIFHEFTCFLGRFFLPPLFIHRTEQNRYVLPLQDLVVSLFSLSLTLKSTEIMGG